MVLFSTFFSCYTDILAFLFSFFQKGTSEILIGYYHSVFFQEFFVNSTPYFNFFLKLHLFYMYLLCGSLIFSEEVQKCCVMISSGLKLFSFSIEILYLQTNITGTFLIITFLNAIRVVFSIDENITFWKLNIKTNYLFTIIAIIYIIWSHPCNLYDPFVFRFPQTDQNSFVSYFLSCFNVINL